ncbi:hypothetical protein CLU79DRAFT_715830 [Phycomyces nitens]|nr:hypothetical protein CLU79DRAFT_715830 [Phycomyces nitens]
MAHLLRMRSLMTLILLMMVFCREPALFVIGCRLPASGWEVTRRDCRPGVSSRVIVINDSTVEFLGLEMNGSLGTEPIKVDSPEFSGIDAGASTASVMDDEPNSAVVAEATVEAIPGFDGRQETEEDNWDNYFDFTDCPVTDSKELTVPAMECSSPTGEKLNTNEIPACVPQQAVGFEGCPEQTFCSCFVFGAGMAQKFPDDEARLTGSSDDAEVPTEVLAEFEAFENSQLPMFVGSLTSFTHPWSWSRSWVYDSINSTNHSVFWFSGLDSLGLWFGSPGRGSLCCRGPRVYPPQYQRTIESRSMDVSPSDICRSYVSELDRLGFLTGSFEPLVGFGLSCVDFCESVD